MKLRYIGRQYVNDTEYFNMWNLIDSPRPDLHPSGSSISLEGLREMGVIK